MKKNTKQYTIRNIPLYVDKILRQKAKESHKSFNQIVLEAILAGTHLAPLPRRDLSEISGTLKSKEAEAVEDEIKKQRQIEKDLWK